MDGSEYSIRVEVVLDEELPATEPARRHPEPVGADDEAGMFGDLFIAGVAPDDVGDPLTLAPDRARRRPRVDRHRNHRAASYNSVSNTFAQSR